MIFHRNKNRVIEIDFLRGVLIIFMIVDHVFFDFMSIIPSLFADHTGLINNLSIKASNYWNWPLRIGTRFAILALFFLISGICCYFSKNNLKRGLIVFGVGLLLGLGFFIYSRVTHTSNYMYFGAIACFGTSILLYFLLRLIFIKLVPNHLEDFKWVCLSLGLLIIGLGLVFDVWNMKRPGPVFTSGDTFLDILATIFGIKQPSTCVDWLPLCPYFGFMLVGSFVGETIYKDKKSLLPKLPSKPSIDDSKLRKVTYNFIEAPYKGIVGVISFTGRHSLIYYLLHQVVIILVLCLTFLAMGYKLNIRL